VVTAGLSPMTVEALDRLVVLVLLILLAVLLLIWLRRP